MDRDEIARSTSAREELGSLDLAEMTEEDVAAEIARRMESWKSANNPPDAGRADAPGAEMPVDGASKPDPAPTPAPSSAITLIYSTDFAALLTAGVAPVLVLRGDPARPRNWLIGRWMLEGWSIGVRAAEDLAEDLATAGGAIGRRAWKELSRWAEIGRGDLVDTAADCRAIMRWTIRAAARVGRGISHGLSHGRAAARTAFVPIVTDCGTLMRRAMLDTAGIGRAAGSGTARALSHGAAAARARVIDGVIAGRAILSGAIASPVWKTLPHAWQALPRGSVIAGAAVLAIAIGGWALMPLDQIFPFKTPVVLAPQAMKTEAPKFVVPKFEVLASEIPQSETLQSKAPGPTAASPQPALATADTSTQATSTPAAPKTLESEKPHPSLIAWLKPTTRPAMADTPAPGPTPPAPNFEDPKSAPESKPEPAKLVAAPQDSGDRIDAQAASNKAASNKAANDKTGGDKTAGDQSGDAAPADDAGDDQEDVWMFDWMFSDELQRRLPRRGGDRSAARLGGRQSPARHPHLVLEPGHRLGRRHHAPIHRT